MAAKEAKDSAGSQHLPALATILSGALAIFLVLVVQETFLLAIAAALACILVLVAMYGARKWYLRGDNKIDPFEQRGLLSFQFFSLLTNYVAIQFAVILVHYVVASFPLPSIPTMFLMVVVLLFLLIVILPHIVGELTKNFVL
jgi:hypothetical protein